MDMKTKQEWEKHGKGCDHRPRQRGVNSASDKAVKRKKRKQIHSKLDTLEINGGAIIVVRVWLQNLRSSHLYSIDPAEWASQCFFTARGEYRQERVSVLVGANQSLVCVRL
jgi:hypothetical protein